MLRAWRRRRLGQTPLPAGWQEILTSNVPLSARLPAALLASYHHALQIFLDEKHFEGCGGLSVSEEMRVTVAGYACLLLLGDPRGYYPRLGTVILYPRSFAAPLSSVDRMGVITERVEERLGESWTEGAVVLAWESITELISGRSADCNVIIHEFAHQLDACQAFTAGRLLSDEAGEACSWEELLIGARGRQRSTRRRGGPAALDPYALGEVTELFAVASETFFMNPLRLRSASPQLHAELVAVYRIDPTAWRGPSREG